MEATTPDGGNSLWYSSAFYDEPEASHTIMQSFGGVESSEQLEVVLGVIREMKK